MIDILFLAHNRLEFTKASFEALLANTNWDLVDRLMIYDDGSIDASSEYLWKALYEHKRGGSLERNRFGSPVAIMANFLRREHVAPPAEFFAKIDNDVIVPPGWLDQCAATFEAHPELDLLGIEGPWSRRPHMSQPFRLQDTHEAELQPGPPYYVPTSAIGGVGVFRRRAFDRAPLVPNGPYGGFEAWQAAHPEVTRGQIAPALNLFLLDRLPIEPWKSLSEEYVAKGWQRKWRDYELSDSHLWDWWAKVEACSA